jgi:small subunit ribosomal protein S16
MLKIRLARIGRKHEPVFRVVLTDSKNAAKSGRVLEVLGNYDSRRGEKAVIDGERVKHWISKGAQLSGTVHNMMVGRKVIEGEKLNVLPKKKPILKEGAGESTATASVATETTPAETPAPAEQAEVSTETAVAE